MAYKVAFVGALMTRVENLSPSGVGPTEEEKHVTDVLRGNNYPSGFIQKHTITSRRREEVKVERSKTSLTLPNIMVLSEAVKRVLTPLGVKVVFRPLQTLRQLLAQRIQSQSKKA